MAELSKNPWSKNLDVIIGGCADEGLLFYYELPSDEQLSKMDKNPALFLPPDLRSKLSPNEGKHRGTILKKLYFKDENITSQNIPKLVDYLGEKQFWHGIFQTVSHRLTSSSTGKTFLYRLNVPPSNDTPDFYDFTRNFSNIPHRNGTCHSEDIPLLFKAAFVKRFKGGDDNYDAAHRFLTTFVAFMHNKMPTNWLPLSSKESSIKCLDVGRQTWQMTNLANADKLRVWEAVYGKDGTKAKY